MTRIAALGILILSLSSSALIYAEPVSRRLYPSETSASDMRREEISSIYDVKLSWIESAERYIDIEMWNMWKYERGSVKELYDALEDACRRGVEIRIAVGADDVEGEHIESGFFSCPGIKVINVSVPAHSKYMIVDEKKVTAGSANWSWSAMEQNYEFNLNAECAATALSFTYLFESLWESEGGEIRGRGAYSGSSSIMPLAHGRHVPGDFMPVYEYQLENIRKAEEKILVSIYRYLPFFRDIKNRIHRELAAAAARGVSVKLLIDVSSYDGGAKRLIDSLASKENIYIKIHDLSNAPPVDGGGSNHTKIFLADGKRGLVSSMNWDRFTFDNSGRDAGIAFEDEKLCSLIEDSFYRNWNSPYAVWADGQSPLLEQVIEKPLVTKLDAVNIAGTSALFEAELSDAGRSEDVTAYFLWQRVPEGNRWQYQYPVTKLSAPGRFSYKADNLIPGEEYALTVQAVNETERTRAPVIYFRTLPHRD